MSKRLITEVRRILVVVLSLSMVFSLFSGILVPVQVFADDETFDVTFDTNGGYWDEEGDPSDSKTVVVLSGESLMDVESELPANSPQKDNYTFEGWNTDSEETTGYQISSLLTFVPEEDTVFYAIWSKEPETFSISYDLNGGNITKENPEVYTDETESFTLNRPWRLGYAFAGWLGTDLSEPTTKVTIPYGSTGDREYTAIWGGTLGYHISYDLNGGVVSEKNPESYNAETASFKINNPTRKGYNFTGWVGTELADPTIDLVINTGSTGDKNYTATWNDQIVYSISYNLCGGAVSGHNPTSYTVETDDFMLINPTKKGYEFAGWTGTDLSEATTEVTIAKGSTNNRSYTATWSNPVEYNISYELNGGKVSSANPTSYTINTEDFTLNNPTRDGYTFEGWLGTDLTEATKNVTVKKGSTGDKNYAATWNDPVGYSISYNLCGGTVSGQNPTSYTIETEDFMLINPTKEGYEFAGWTGTDLSKATTDVTIYKGSTKNRSYTATWSSPIEYNISYDLNGGKVSSANPTNYTIETDDFALNNPTRDGYTFEGWLGTDLTMVTKDVTINKGSTKNRSYTAVWSDPVEYSISYNLCGGTVSGQNITSYTIETEDFMLTNPTKEGYEFTGWTGTDLSKATIDVTIYKGSAKNRSYTATWSSPIEYNISYELNGGTVSGANPTNYTIETEDFALINPTRDGYTFAGWTGTDLLEATTDVTIYKGSTNNRSYTAIWSDPIEYSISYNLCGGTVSGQNIESYTIETEDFMLINPTKEGYEFAGWTGTDLSKATTNVTIYKGSTKNRSYTATWSSPIEYSISYELNGGTVSGANPTNYTIETEDFALINPTRDGYTFEGWLGTDLTMVTKDVTINKGSTKNRSYTAVWSDPIEYSISYNICGGTVSGQNPTSYTVETEDFMLINPTRDGYTFAGWLGTSFDGYEMTVTVAKGSIGDCVFTATWSEANVFTISYNNLDGATVNPANPTSYTIETEDFTLNNPTKLGYGFTGWTGTSLSTNMMNVTISKGSIGNRSYFANWNLTSYRIEYELNGGVVDEKLANPTSYSIETDSFTLTNPTKEGYNFVGWTGTEVSSPSIKLTVKKGSIGDRKYIANWKMVDGSDTPKTVSKNSSLYLKATVTNNAKKETSVINLSWKKVKGTSYFEIYGAPCENDNQIPRIATLQNNKISYKIKDAKWNTDYTYFVKAFKSDGTVLMESLPVYVVTGLGEQSNVKSINAKNITVRMNKTAKIVPTIVLREKGKKEFGGQYTKMLRYFSSNPSIAEVNEDGMVTGKATGKATVFIYAPNGVLKKITVNVTNPIMFLSAKVTSQNIKNKTANAKLTWSKVEKATTYNIYGAPSGSELVKVATVKRKNNSDTNNMSYTIKNLNRETEYEYIVKAVDANGNEFYESTKVLFVAGSDSKTNAKQIKASNKTMNIGSTHQIITTIVGTDGKKTIIGDGQTNNLVKYFSLNPNIATVSETGLVTAIANGKAKIYIFAPNGVKKAVTINVR